jgi:hypothetical protein
MAKEQKPEASAPATPAGDASSVVSVERLDPVQVHDAFGAREVVRVKTVYADGTVRIDN